LFERLEVVLVGTRGRLLGDLHRRVGRAFADTDRNAEAIAEKDERRVFAVGDDAVEVRHPRREREGDGSLATRHAERFDVRDGDRRVDRLFDGREIGASHAVLGGGGEQPLTFGLVEVAIGPSHGREGEKRVGLQHPDRILDIGARFTTVDAPTRRCANESATINARGRWCRAPRTWAGRRSSPQADAGS
jgi:hypothetical protein